MPHIILAAHLVAHHAAGSRYTAKWLIEGVVISLGGGVLLTLIKPFRRRADRSA